MIDRQGKRLLRLIEDILFAGRLEAGDTVVHAEQCDVAAIAADVVESYAAQPEGRRVRLVPPVGPLPVCSDPLAVHQIIQNLVDNALKYAPGSPIEVVARRDGAEVVVTIVDHGPGVAVADRDRIFERFRQGDGSITRAASGVGLGLYIVRNLVEGLDGRVWCDGEPGQGARFSFTLPTRTLEEVLQ
jgi:signal transduction histidine kinase